MTALAASLQSVNGVELIQAKGDLAALLAKVASRVKSQGGGTLPERMALAASVATSSALSLQDAQKLCKGMTTKLRVKVDKADPCRGLIQASAVGTWGLFDGQSFGFKATVKDVMGTISGQIRIEGLDFKADKDLSAGKFDCNAKAFIKASGVDLTENNILRALVTSLEVLVRKKAAGLADVDVLGTTFNLMRVACGLPATVEAPDSGSEAEAGDDDEAEDEVEESEAEPEEASESVKSDEMEPLPDSDGEGEEEEEKSEEEKSEEACESPRKASDAEDDGLPTKRVKRKPLIEASPTKSPTKASDNEEDKKSNRADSDEERVPECEGDSPSKKDNLMDDSEGEDTTVFVSRKAFKPVKDKLAKKQEPTQAMLARLADFDAVPDGEDVICIDASVLGPAFTSEGGDRKEAVKALVAAHGLKGAAELFIKAEEAAGLELGDDEGEEGEEEESGEPDEVQEASDDEAPAAKASPKKAAAAKAASAKAIAAKATAIKCSPKKAAAKQPAAKRARTS